MSIRRNSVFTAARWGRPLTLFLLLLALWDPPLPWGTPPLDLILLLDDSASMPRAQSDQAWHDISHQALTLPSGSRFRLIRFAGDSHDEGGWLSLEALQELRRHSPDAPPRSQRLQQGQTDLEQALRHALVSVSPQRLTLILLATDGRQTRGDLATVIDGSRQDVTLSWWRPPAAAEDDVWIEALQLPERISGGQRLPATLQLASRRPLQVRLQLKLDRQVVDDIPLTLNGDTPLTLQRRLPLPPGSSHLFEAQLIHPGDPQPGNNLRRQLIQVQEPTRVLHIGPPSAMVQELRKGGWPVTSVTPQRFHGGLLPQSDLILLDDLPISALSEADWQAIAMAVRNDGSGLLLLGGPHSFGGGGYRHTLLERLLPVTAEARRPQDRAAVLFLLDKSGSMEQVAQAGGESRMAIARRAIESAASLLQPGDLTGLITFDVETRIRLPLDNYPNPARRISQAWDFAPRGGTRLQPALAQALELLQASPVEQRIILLLTDGFIERQEDFSGIATALQRSGVDLIALTIGGTAEDKVLTQLSRINQGALLPVTDLIRLPRLLQNEVIQRRAALELGEIHPRIQDLPPLFNALPTPWPVLGGYMATRERPQARVWLSAENGDPLIASWYAGAGRVTVLTAGLGQWAPAWRQWPGWGRLLGGLVEWNGRGYANPDLYLARRPLADGIALTLDLLSDGRWAQRAQPEILLLDPNGQQQRLPAELVAPGRYRSLIRRPLSGEYRVQARLGERRTSLRFYHQPLDEFSPESGPASPLRRAVQQGTVQPWEPGLPLRGPVIESSNISLRLPLLLLALLAFLATLWMERDIPLPGWIRGRKWMPRQSTE